MSLSLEIQCRISGVSGFIPIGGSGPLGLRLCLERFKGAIINKTFSVFFFLPLHCTQRRIRRSSDIVIVCQQVLGKLKPNSGESANATAVVTAEEACCFAALSALASRYFIFESRVATCAHSAPLCHGSTSRSSKCGN